MLTVQSQSLTILIIASKYVLTVCTYCRTKPAERSHAAGSGEEVTATTPCEAYNLVNFDHEYEDLFAYQKRECETPIAQHPANTPINETPIAQRPANTPINETPIAERPANTPINETPIAQRPANTPINETPIAQCPADTPINKSGDEDVSETAQSS